jgi:serine/threonine-protein kinase
MSGEPEATAKLAPCSHCGEPHGEDQLRCPKTDMLLPLEGRRLDGKFRFISTLGTGGMAAVWLARNERVDREVAIKFLRPEIGRDPEAVARFRSEARAAGRIGNKHICEILDLGDSPIGPYMVMERLRGIDLAALIRRKGRLQPGYAVRIVRHALEGLAAAHAAGIIHRDLKPGNVFLHRDDHGETQVKLMDFGVSKFLDGSGDAMTASGILLGTPEYMAPEQLEGANKLGPASDIFAMGAILYRSISGHQVFSGANLAAVLRAMAVGEPTPIDRLVSGLPPELVAVIHRCLARAPEARFPSAEALSDALAPFELLDIETTPLAAAGPSLEPPAPAPSIDEPLPEILPSVMVKLVESDEQGESATKMWRQDATGPLRPERDEPTRARASTSVSARASTSVSAPAPASTSVSAPASPSEPVPTRSRTWVAVLVAAGLLGVLAWQAHRHFGSLVPLGSGEANRSGLDEATLPVGDGSSGSSSTDDGLAETSEGGSGAPESSSSSSGESTSGSGESESGAETGTEGETGTAGETGTESETSGESGGDAPEPGPREVSTNRPAPAGTLRGGGYVTPVDPGGTTDFQAARKQCEALAARRFAGIGKWRLASIAEANEFVGTKIKSSRYWTAAAWQGKARVYTLPKVKKESEPINKKIARPLCVARW